MKSQTKLNENLPWNINYDPTEIFQENLDSECFFGFIITYNIGFKKYF